MRPTYTFAALLLGMLLGFATMPRAAPAAAAHTQDRDPYALHSGTDAQGLRYGSVIEAPGVEGTCPVCATPCARPALMIVNDPERDGHQLMGPSEGFAVLVCPSCNALYAVAVARGDPPARASP